MADFRPLFTLLGVPWTYDERSWQFVLPKLFIGVFAAFFFRRDEPGLDNVVIGIVYGLLLNGLLILHVVGHILSSKRVTPPMTEARITPRLIQTRFDNDPDSLTPEVHLLRTVGGLLMNLLLGVLGFAIWQATDSHFAGFFMAANWLLVLGILLPIPSTDGEVIWQELPKLRRKD